MTIPAENPVNSAPSDLSAVTLSVVVPCRNERAYIDETLRSILAQQNVAGGIELIVVDGLSEDGTRERLDQLQATYSNLRVLDNEYRTTSYAMNQGIEAAKGSFVAVLGAHTTYAPDYLATCLDLLSEHPEADCVGGPIESRGNGSFGRAVALAMSHPVGVGNARHRFPDYEGYAEGACFPVFRREALARAGRYDPALVHNQDDDFNYRFRDAGGKVYLSPRARSVYYVRDTVSALFQQYYRYGYWRLRVLRKHGKVASWRQLAPVLFFAGIIFTAPLALITPAPWLWIWVAIPGVYALSLAGSALLSIPRIGIGAALRVPVAMLTMHLAYAIGFVSSWLTPWAADSGTPS